MRTDAGAEAEGVVDLAGLARSGPPRKPVWAHEGADLDVNLLVLERGEEIAEHVNPEVDVLLVGIVGNGVVEVAGRRHDLAAGQALIVPKGTERAITSRDGRFAYRSCPRRRGELRLSLRRREPGSA